MNLPNRITLLRIAMVPVVAVLLSFPSWTMQLWAAIAFSVASATDLLDGYIARKYGLETDFGRFVDPIADKLLISAAMVVMVAQLRLPAWVVILFISREFIISAFRLVAATKGVVISADKLGKYKTLAQTFAVILLTLLIPVADMKPALGIFGVVVAQITTYTALLLSTWSCIHYILKNKQIL